MPLLHPFEKTPVEEPREHTSTYVSCTSDSSSEAVAKLVWYTHATVQRPKIAITSVTTATKLEPDRIDSVRKDNTSPVFHSFTFAMLRYRTPLVIRALIED